MNDLITWLRAQLDEDERAAPDIHNAALCESTTPYGQACNCGWPARVLAEVAAKRRLLEAILNYEAKIDGEWGCCHSADGIAEGLCPETPPDEIKAVRLLALPYADRPGYRDEWRP